MNFSFLEVKDGVRAKGDDVGIKHDAGVFGFAAGLHAGHAAEGVHLLFGVGQLSGGGLRGDDVDAAFLTGHFRHAQVHGLAAFHGHGVTGVKLRVDVGCDVRQKAGADLGLFTDEANHGEGFFLQRGVVAVVQVHRDNAHLVGGFVCGFAGV